MAIFPALGFFDQRRGRLWHQGQRERQEEQGLLTCDRSSALLDAHVVDFFCLYVKRVVCFVNQSKFVLVLLALSIVGIVVERSSLSAGQWRRCLNVFLVSLDDLEVDQIRGCHCCCTPAFVDLRSLA
ncbi:hypothetical protein KCU61_g178, partial [Aureobasidium melanogenum]